MSTLTAAGSATADRTDESEAAEPPEPAQGGAIELELIDRAGLAQAQRRWLCEQAKRAVRCALEAFGSQQRRSAPASVRLLLLDAQAMARLHSRTHDDPSPTDVVTIPLHEGADEPLDVDIALCLDVAREQAALRNETVERELLLYVVHGLLHALGLDDRDEAQAQRMREAEGRIFRALGLEPVA